MKSAMIRIMLGTVRRVPLGAQDPQVEGTPAKLGQLGHLGLLGQLGTLGQRDQLG